MHVRGGDGVAIEAVFERFHALEQRF